MDINATLLKSLEDTFSGLAKAIQRFNETAFNEKPAKSNWSPAMVAQHLILAGTDIDKVLLGNTKATEGKVDGKIAQLKGIFLDFVSKFTSPEFIEPADQIYNKQVLLEQLNAIEKSVTDILPGLDLSLTCLDFEMPYMGFLTRQELISFLIYHTQRHTHQLNEMADKQAPNYVGHLEINTTVAKVFEALTNKIPLWWTEMFGGFANKEGETFTVRFGDNVYKTILVLELAQNEKVVWQVKKSLIAIPELKKQNEWEGTTIVWKM
ncbi:DinB family protein, partial [Pedobacter sp. UBA4863]|uniref:DinB family protein n=1 Tax=Pedobacter sp. UBA4863 TaxID=1947060 RepID=UPI0025D32AE0